METKVVQVEKRGQRLLYIGFAFIMALVYDRLFWHQAIGLNFLVFVLLYLLGFIALTAWTRQLRTSGWLIGLVPLIILSADTAVFANDLVTKFVPPIVFVGLSLFSLAATVRNPAGHRFSFFGIPLWRSIDLPFVKWGALYRDLFQWEGHPRQTLVKRIFLGIVFALPFVIIFTLLFAKADAVFADWVERVFHFDIPATVWRTFRTFAFTLFASSFFYVIIGEEHSLLPKTDRVRRLDSIIIGIILAAINLLFGLFVFIQFKYLFGGAQFVTDSGVTFADYARNGFFQLAWVVVLAGILLTITYRSFVRHGSHPFINALQFLLIAQVGIIAASALKRMNLYQLEYGYTVLRLYVEWTIYLVIALLLIGGVSLLARWPFRNFWYTALVVSGLSFTVVASLNVEYFIARQNIQRFLVNNKTIDLDYLRKLSPDILPALPPLLEPAVVSRLALDDKLRLWDMLGGMYDFLSSHARAGELHLVPLRFEAVATNLDATTVNYLREAVKLDVAYAKRSTFLQSHDISNCTHTDLTRSVACVSRDFGSRHFVYALAYQTNEADSTSKAMLTVYEISIMGMDQAVTYTPIFNNEWTYPEKGSVSLYTPGYRPDRIAWLGDNSGRTNDYFLQADGTIVEGRIADRTFQTYKINFDGQNFSVVPLPSVF